MLWQFSRTRGEIYYCCCHAVHEWASGPSPSTRGRKHTQWITMTTRKALNLMVNKPFARPQKVSLTNNSTETWEIETDKFLDFLLSHPNHDMVVIFTDHSHSRDSFLLQSHGVFTLNWAPANLAGRSQQGTCFCIVHTSQINIDCRHYGDHKLGNSMPNE